MFKWIFLAALSSGLVLAQGSMPMQGPMPMGGGFCGRGRLAQDLNLSDTQQKQISTICQDSYKKLSDLRETTRNSEAELQAAFDESPVDQHKSSDAIEHLTAARSELFRATSQMDLKIRTVLTDEQWHELKQRERRMGPGRPGGPDRGGWRRGGPSGKTTAPTITQQPSK
jgi:Spy/CpxP family protein refolding chaperone